MTIHWPKWIKLINERFVPLIENKDRFLILWGGRGSSKSDAIAKKLIFRCLNDKYFRFLLVRKVYNSVKNSQWQTIKDTIEHLGLAELFTFNITPLEIRCKVNGNKFIAAGCDDPSRLKSTKDPTGAWYEEDIIDESDWITITTSIRTGKADYLQEIFTINPEVEGNFEDNWFWKRFFKDKIDKNFRDRIMIEIDGKEISLYYTSHHSTYHDNRWIPDEFKAFLEDLKIKNPYYYTIYTLGEWGNKIIGGQAYKGFDRSRNTTQETYNPEKSLHITFDFNVRPYMSLAIWQITDKKAVQIDEIIGIEPNNNTPSVCRLFARKYDLHQAGLFIYGDPAGRQQDTRDEKGYNDFNIIQKELKKFNPRFRVAESAPPVVSRINFINSIMSAKNFGIEILINEKCSYTIMDYLYGKESADGTKFKEKFKDKDTGVTAERYHHLTDANDYLLTMVFKSDFNNYLRGNRERVYLVGEPRSNFERD